MRLHVASHEFMACLVRSAPVRAKLYRKSVRITEAYYNHLIPSLVWGPLSVQVFPSKVILTKSKAGNADSHGSTSYNGLRFI